VFVYGVVNREKRKGEINVKGCR